ARPRLARLRRRTGGCEVEPLAGLDDILRHAKTPVVEQPERVLREAVALLGGAPGPHRRLGIVLRYAAAALVHEAQIRLRGRVAPLGIGREDLRRRHIVLAVEGGDALLQRSCGGGITAEQQHGRSERAYRAPQATPDPRTPARGYRIAATIGLVDWVHRPS